MIVGTGIDLLEVSRLQSSLARHGQRFAQRILCTDELVVFEQRGGATSHKGVLYLATRFAAKEAFGKAWGTGIGKTVGFHGLSVLNDENGRPVVVCHGELAATMAQCGLKAWVSLSDERHCVIAQVLIENTLHWRPDETAARRTECNTKTSAP